MRSPSLLASVLSLLIVGCTPPTLREANPPIDLVIAATTDVHGYLRGWDYFGNRADTVRGLSRAATIVDSLRRVSAVWPVVGDAGELLRETLLTYTPARIDTTMPHPVMLAMNVMRYDAAAI